MRLAPALLAAALAAVAVAHEWQGDDDWELDDGERKGHPVGQFGGDRGDGSKEASWWEKLQGKGPAEHEGGHPQHGNMHHARDAMIPEGILPAINDDANDDTDYAKHHHGHHEHHKHGHKGEHHHKGAHAGGHKGNPADKAHEKGKLWSWLNGQGHEPILPREASEPVETHDGFPEQEHHKGHKHGHHHGEHHPGHHKGEHHHKGPHSGAHKGGHGNEVCGKHPHNEHAHFHEGVGHHKPEGLWSPHMVARGADTDEVGPDNEFFDSTDFDDDDFDDEDEDDSPSLSARDVNGVEQTEDPNEVSGDEDYYHFGDDGDDDVLDGKLTDSPDDDDDDGDMGEDAQDGDDEDNDASGSAEKLKRWAEAKKHG